MKIFAYIGLAALAGCTELPVAPLEPATAAGSTGVVPDYAPLTVVLTHAMLPEIAPALPRALSELLGEQHVVARHDWRSDDGGGAEADRSALWMRDYQPIFVRSRGGQLRPLRYLSLNPQRSAFGWAELGGEPPAQLPIVHENGNLVAVGRDVFVTEALLEMNAAAHEARHLKTANYRPRGREELLRLLADALEVEPERIVVLPRMPHEQSGHVDLFLLALDDSTVVVPAVEARALEATEGREREVAADVQAFLDEQSAALAARGLEVLRLPMIAPALVDVGPSPQLVLFTPANMLLVRHRGERVAFCPASSAWRRRRRSRA